MSDFSDDDVITIHNLQRRIEHSWNALHTFLETLTPPQQAEMTDPAGWTVKDHTIHLSVWEGRLVGILTRQKFPEAMGIPQAIWEQDDEAVLNAYIQTQHRYWSWEDVRVALQASHAAVLSEIAAMGDTDLLRPYRDYQPDSDEEQPVIAWIVGNTFAHYADHLGWMQAIIAPTNERGNS